MRRRRFLTGLAAIPLLSSIRRWLPTSTRAAAASPTIRRVRPSDPSWPTAASWEKLKQQVGGHLVPVSSPLAPCREAPGSAACAARIEEMQNPCFIGEQAGGTQTSGWLDGWTSAPSAYAVAVRRSEDVVAAVGVAGQYLVERQWNRGQHFHLRREHYFAHRSWFFGALVASIAFSAAKELALRGHLPGRMNGVFHALFGLAAIAGAITRREWFHKLLAPAVGLLFLLYIALLFARL